MEQYISKDAIIAKIESIESETNYEPFTKEMLGKRKVCKDIRDFLGTFEVKEVNLDKGTTHYLLYKHRSPLNEIMHTLTILIIICLLLLFIDLFIKRLNL